MKERCWETCDACAEAGLEKCNAVRQVEACTNCLQSGARCTELSKGQVTDGAPIEIVAAGSDQDEQPQNTQPDSSHTQDDSRDVTEQGLQHASGNGPQQLLAVQVSPVGDRDNKAYSDGQEDETAGSSHEGIIHEDKTEKEGSHKAPLQSPSISQASLTNTDNANPNILTDSPKATESRQLEGLRTSPRNTSRSDDSKVPPPQDQPQNSDVTAPTSPKIPSSSIVAVPTRPPTQTRPQGGKYSS